MARLAHGRRDEPENELLPSPPKPEFELMWHPSIWGFETSGTDKDGNVVGEWLPGIRKFSYDPGVNGIKAPKDGGHLEAKAYFESQGWVFLPIHMEVLYTDDDGKIAKGKGYRQIFSGTQGDIWHDIWACPIVIGSGSRAKVDWQSAYDVHGKKEWRRWMVKTGIIPLPSRAVLADMIKSQERRVGRKADEAHAGAAPMVIANQTAKEARLSAMIATAEKIGPTTIIRGRRDDAR